MKKTDFDVIQEKLNTSLDAPEQVDKDFILQQLEGIEPAAQSNIVPLPAKRRKKRTISAIAAAVAVVLIGAIGFGVIPNIPKSDVLAPWQGSSKAEVLTAYTNYSQIKKDIKKFNNKPFSFFSQFLKSTDEGENYILEEDSALTYGDTAATQNGTKASFGKTFTQVERVEEDDIIQTDGRYIYYAGNITQVDYDDDTDIETTETDHSCVYIFSAEGKQSKLVQTLRLEKNEDYSNYIEGIYVSGNSLIVIYSSDIIHTAVYDISDIKNIKKIATFAQSGKYSASRLIGDKLYLVSGQSDNEIPRICCGDAAQKIPAQNIYKTEHPTCADFLVISQADITNGDKLEQAKAVLGGSGKVYCNEEHMYVLADITDTEAYNNPRSQIIKVDLEGEIAFTASAAIDGAAKNQYALDEYNDVFRVAVTDYSDEGYNTNRLYTFDENLKPLGKVEDFAKGEHIEAVRFLGDTAYVITYETTDPLFVIDLSEPAKPAILGEVKISGFSTTLIPIGSNRVLGIGVDDSDTPTGIRNLKLALFDISDRANPKVLDEKICTNISSDAMWETKAILCNVAKQNFTVYATFEDNITKKYNDEPGNAYYYYDCDTSYGTLTFSVQGEQIVTEQAYRSQKLADPSGRCTGDTIYMIDTALHIDCTEYK